MIKMAGKRGFSLMELMVVVMIIAILAGIALPNYSTSVERVKAAEGVEILTSLLGAQKRFSLENGGAYSAVLGDMDITIPASNNFNAPTLATNNPIASIVRTGNLYTLRISDTGAVTCTDPGSGICNRIRIW